MAKIQTLFKSLARFAGTPLARRLVLGLFVAQAAVLVFTVRIGTPPDETNHIHFIEYYANHSLDPVFTDQQPTYNLGDKTREVDYLYHYLMSLLYRITPFEAEGKYMVIRLLTVLFGLLCLVVLAKVFRRVGFSEAVITVGLLVVTNLPMVLMMSSAVNNDVLVWLGTAVGFWLLIRLWARLSAIDLAWLATLVIAGGITKRNLLPLCLVFGVIGLVVFIRHFGAILAQLRRLNWQLCAALAALLLSIGLFAERIGGNVLTYGSVVVSCERVQGEAACYNFWDNVRSRSLAQKAPEELMPPAQFVLKWTGYSAYNIVDIQTQAWRHDVKPARGLPSLLLYLLVIGLIYGIWYERKRFKSEQQSRWRVYIVAMALFFVLVQLAVNYATYQEKRFFGIALNGRYILPSILPLAVFAGFYWSKLLARYPKSLMVFSVTVVLLTIFCSGLIMMLRNSQLYNG